MRAAADIISQTYRKGRDTFPRIEVHLSQDPRMVKFVSPSQKAIRGCSGATALCCAEINPSQVIKDCVGFTCVQ